jgi:glycosyltransferase involved in cell wall biosynthesis
MFGNRLACFPIVSKKLLEKINFFPLPYQRYKVDDTLYHIIPPKKRCYLSNIEFNHDNDHGVVGHGFQLADGRVYPIIPDAAKHDEEQWISESSNRMRMKRIINGELGINIPKVVVGVPTQEMARRADFYDAINLLQVPEGIELLKTFSHGQSPAKGRNVIIEEALKNDCTHILFLDDDVYPQPDAISRLLIHDKDIVTGLYVSRSYPHRPYIFSKANPNGSCVWDFLYDGKQGLVEIVGAGMGICLIKMEVFRALEKPWIRLGELESDNWCDDLGFFKRVREAGFKIYCDLDCIAMHSFSGKVYPKYMEGKWYTCIDTQGISQPTFPQLIPTEVVEEKKEEEYALSQSGNTQ